MQNCESVCEVQSPDEFVIGGLFWIWRFKVENGLGLVPKSGVRLILIEYFRAILNINIL